MCEVKDEKWTLSQIGEKFQNGNCCDFTIWVGSGVSASKPTCLPMGNQLNDFVLSNYFLNSGRILEHWRRVNNIIEELSQWNLAHNLFYPRLELVIECAMYTERYLFPENKFTSGFRSFDSVSPNIAHECLAMLFHHGAKIITANFDTAIEKAYQNKYGAKIEYVNGKHNCAVISKAQNQNEIIHFHGTSLSGFYMGGSLINMINSMDSNIMRKVKKCFGKGKINLFLGYSLSDVYDINEILLDIKNTKNNAINIVCNHNGTDRFLLDKVSYLMGEHGYMLISDTTHFLLKIVNLCLKREVRETTLPTICWQDNFIRNTYCSYEYKFFTTLYLLTKLKIQPEIVLPDYTKDYIKIRSRIVDAKATIWDLHLFDLSNLLDSDTYDYYEGIKKNLDNMNVKVHSQNQVSELRKNLVDLRELRRIIEKRQFITYEESIPMSHYMKIIIYKVVKGESLGTLADIEGIIDLVLGMHYKKSISLVVYASCLRYKIIFKALKYEKNDELFKRAFDLYYDFGNLDGVISCLIYKAISDNIMDKKTFRLNLLIIKARELAELNRRKKYLDQINFLCNL